MQLKLSRRQPRCIGHIANRLNIIKVLKNLFCDRIGRNQTLRHQIIDKGCKCHTLRGKYLTIQIIVNGRKRKITDIRRINHPVDDPIRAALPHTGQQANVHRMKRQAKIEFLAFGAQLRHAHHIAVDLIKYDIGAGIRQRMKPIIIGQHPARVQFQKPMHDATLMLGGGGLAKIKNINRPFFAVAFGIIHQKLVMLLWHQNLAFADVVGRRHDTFVFHLLNQSGGLVIADR